MRTVNSKLKVFLLIIFSTILSGIPSLLKAQIFNHITPRDGITGGYVNDIYEDSKGFIWFATNTGLDKYDGYEYDNFRASSEDSTSISNSRVLNVFELNESTYLIAHQIGIDILNPATKEARELEIQDSTTNGNLVYDFALQNQNALWAGVDGGIYLIDPTSLDSPNPEVQFFSNPLSDASIASTLGKLLIKNDSTIWIGTNSGMFAFDIPSKSFSNTFDITEKGSEVIQSSVWKILKSKDGHIFVAADSGLAILRNGEESIDAITELGELDEDQIRTVGFQALSEDTEGNIWFGTALYGVIKWNLETDEIMHIRIDEEDDNSIQSDDIHYIFTGNLNEVWFGYHNLGISLMFDRSWNYTIEQPFLESEIGSPENFVSAVAESDDGTLWLGTNAGLAQLMPGQEPKLIPLPEDQVPFVGLVQLIGNELFGFNSDGQSNTSIFSYNIDSEEFQFYENPIGVQLEPFMIYEVDNSLLFPVNTSDFIGFDIEEREFFQKNIPQLSENTAENQQSFTIPLLDNEDNILVISLGFGPGGIDWNNFIYDSNSDEFTRSIAVPAPGNNGFGPPQVSKLEPGLVYIRLNNGLFSQNFLTGATGLLFERESGILGESNGILLEDNDGYIWTINSTGIMRLDPITESISYFELEEDRFDVYGIPTLLNNGDILYVGSGGVLRFNPDQLQEEDPISNIHINSLQTGDEIINILYEEHDKLEIASSDNNISFLYTGINYKEPTYTQYRYRLIGYSDEWNEVGTQRNVFVPNLPPSNYTMQVQAASRFGGFTGPIAEINFTVLPPIWRTIPAYILYFLLLVGSIISVDRFQRRRLLRLAKEKSREKELAQAKEIEKAYTNLKAAQTQLVQQEKLASLGQLTAGIAHEIKNPLNFVNNFSDLSIELLDEARDELQKTPADAEEALEILKDVEANLNKIHEHGTRADKIVKSMLQHSRGGSGKLEPTDLNALVSESVNLSFHGMRAGKNPINVDIDLDLDDSIEKIPLIGEDFSRVIINLSNNAFDAMRGKLDGSEYKPKLTVRTSTTKNKIKISIEDNGPGIPDHIKDQILQPFFTTKKGTEGTGLGLSITNDIIKAHRGSLEIESKVNEFTRFEIFLTDLGK